MFFIYANQMSLHAKFWFTLIVHLASLNWQFYLVLFEPELVQTTSSIHKEVLPLDIVDARMCNYKLLALQRQKLVEENLLYPSLGAGFDAKSAILEKRDTRFNRWDL